MAEPELVLLGTLDFNEAKRIRSALEDRGVRLELATSPEAFGSCSPGVQVFGRVQDLDLIRSFMREEHSRMFLGLHVPGEERVEKIYDTDADTAECPACQTVFSTQLKECPDCGLVFMTE